MEVIPLGTTAFQYQGLLDDQQFYNFLKDTLKGYGYDLTETSYIQFAGANYVIRWDAKKVVDDYMAYRITIDLNYRGITETTAMKDGKSVKAKTGTVEVKLTSDILLDYLNKWTTGVSKFVRPVYDKMNSEVTRKRREAFENEIQNIKSVLQAHFA